MTRKRATTSRGIAISLLSLSLLLIFSSVSFAETAVGRVTHLSGPLFAQKADGTMRVLTTNSAVEQGDTLVTGKKTYTRIKFTDNSVLNMRPGTQLKVSQYNFDQAKPIEDKAFYYLKRGGLRAITGLIGKRSDPHSYQMVTDTSVAGVRGTTYEIRICEDNCGSIPNGFYLLVLEGIVNITNKGGSHDVSAGQYVYVKTAESIPTILPGNPGIDFTLPTFMGDSPKEGGASNVGPGCVVR